MRNYHHGFYRFGTYFDDRLKILTYRQNSTITFLFTNFPMKIKVSQAQITEQIFQVVSNKR